MPNKIKKVMKEFKKGTLHSGSKTGPKVKSKKQAVAIAISEQKRADKKIGKRGTAKTFKRARKDYFGL